MQNKRRENKKTPKVRPTSGVFCECCKASGLQHKFLCVFSNTYNVKSFRQVVEAYSTIFKNRSLYFAAQCRENFNCRSVDCIFNYKVFA